MNNRQDAKSAKEEIKAERSERNRRPPKPLSIYHFLLGVLGVLAVISLASVRARATNPDPGPSIPGYVKLGGRYVPAEPYKEGQLRATGLQKPFPRMFGVDENPTTPEKAALGRLLFFDPTLSGDNKISCAHCHHPDLGFADGRKLSMGRGGRGVGPERTGGDVLQRNAPSLWNAAYNTWQFLDGRAADLEHQAEGPITNEHEMASKPEDVIEKLKEIPEYKKLFADAFFDGDEPALTFRNVGRALASFERTLLTFNSKFDRYAAGESAALNDQEKRGMKLFRSLKTRCFECHTFPTFSDPSFRVIGVPDEGPRDEGRGGVPNEGPGGAFKVPTLRNVALSAPYMHNGKFEKLEDVIDFYSKGGGNQYPGQTLRIDDKIEKFDITPEETADLAAFLKSLTDTSLMPEAPESVPSGLPVVAVKSRPIPAPPMPSVVAAPAIPKSIGGERVFGLLERPIRGMDAPPAPRPEFPPVLWTALAPK